MSQLCRTQAKKLVAMISPQAAEDLADTFEMREEADLMKLYRTPPTFQPPAFTIAFYGIIGAERPAKHTEQESFLFVLRTPSNHLTLLPLAEATAEEVAYGILRPYGDATLSTPMHLVSTTPARHENELLLAQYRVAGRDRVGALWTEAYGPTDRQLFRQSTAYKLASGLNEIANYATIGQAWPTLLFNAGEVRSENLHR